MYQLICEGRCNPGLSTADRLAARFKESEAKSDLLRVEIDQRAMVAAQRMLVHTPHDVTQETQATCLQCGHERRYGGVPVYLRMAS